MPEYVVQRIADALNSAKKPLNGSRVHLLGVAYKKDVGDVRESPALDILELLVRRGATVTYTDPFVPAMQHGGHTYQSVPFDGTNGACWDCVVVATDHSAFDYDRIASFPLVVDTRNAIKRAGGQVFTL
jgi:UDP-N-acetyl-D-glucosamine dehydrogenase